MWHLSPEHLLSSARLSLTSDKLTDVSVGTFRNGTGVGFLCIADPRDLEMKSTLHFIITHHRSDFKILFWNRSRVLVPYSD